jgi:hypothetical protein
MPKKTPAKKPAFGADLIEGMKLVLAHQRGQIELEQVWPKQVDAKPIRKRAKGELTGCETRPGKKQKSRRMFGVL